VPKHKSRKSPERRKTRAPLAKQRRKKRRGLWMSLFKIGLVTLLMWSIVGALYYAWALAFDLKGIHDMNERSVIFDHAGILFPSRW
jgi:hypothetical protein